MDINLSENANIVEKFLKDKNNNIIQKKGSIINDITFERKKNILFVILIFDQNK